MRQGCKIIQLGESVAIMCGTQPDHECNEKAIVCEFSDGFVGTVHDKAKAEKINLNMCDEDKLYFINEKDIQIRSVSVACTICGRAAIDNAMYL